MSTTPIDIEARPLLPDSDKGSKRRRAVAAFITIGVALTLCITIGVVAWPASENVNEPDNKGPVLKSVSTHAATQCPTGTYELKVGSTTRKFDVYTPSSATSNSAMVFVWHGIASSPSQIEAKVKMKAQSDLYGWVAVFPYGVGFLSAFHGRGCCDNKPQDTEFAYEIIDYLSELECASADKVFSSGFSNGGFMGHELGCRQDGTATEVFKAIASHSGLIGDYSGSLPNWESYSKCGGSDPPPFLSIHGSQDTTVPTAGGNSPNPFDNAVWYSLENSMNIWRKKHNCDSSNDISDQVTSTTMCLRNSGCEVTTCMVTGLAHDWSGNKGNNDLAATEYIAAFFIKHGANN